MQKKHRNDKRMGDISKRIMKRLVVTNNLSKCTYVQGPFSEERRLQRPQLLELH